MLQQLRPLKRSIVVLVCVGLPLLFAGGSLASGTPTKGARHKPPVRHSPKRVAGIAPKPKLDATTILVKFLKPSTAVSAVRAAGDRPLRSVAGVELVKLQPGESVAAKVRQYDRRRDVAYAEPNYLVHAAALPAPNDILYQASQQGVIDTIHAVGGWSIFPGSYTPLTPTPTIAVVDSGVDFTHPDLTGQAAAGSAVCVSAVCTADPAPDVSNSSHGTEVAGIVGAVTNNNEGIAGVAYSSKLMSVRVLDANDSGSFANAAAGITWAASHGAKVINVSFGGTGFSATLCTAVTQAIAQGAVVVAAAGNSGNFNVSGSATPFYPAACPGAVGVAATFNNDTSPQFSNFGFPDVFMSAPGVNEISTDPHQSPGPYTTGSLTGTSFAAPFVSGAAALLLGQYPGRTNTDVKRVLARTAVKAGQPTFPYGADPFHTCSTCTWSQFYGYGRVDLLSALTGPTPVVAGVTPQSGPVGTSVAITGDDFTGATSVKFGLQDAGAPAITDSGHITTSVPAGATNGKITVVTPGGSGQSAGAFQVVPTLSATSGKVGDTLTISGPKLDDSPMVSFGGAAAIPGIVDSATQVHVTIPIAARTGRITVATASSGLTPYTSADVFTITPTITLVNPASATAGSPVMIQGTGFNGLTSLTFNGIPATFSGVTPTTIRTHVPGNATTGKIQITTAGGSVQSAANFAVKPTVTSFLPTRGVVGSLVTITGSGFSGTPTVEFNGIASTSVTVQSATSLRATVPALASSGKIRVTTADGTSLSSASFLLQPRISAITPSPDPGGPVGTAVTIDGTSFTGATAVRFNGVDATFTVVSDTQITTTVPAAATTGLVSVVTPADTAVFATAFKVKPTITGISPGSGQTGSLVTITGTTLTGATSVSFNGAASGFTVVDPGTIQATVPTTATNGPITVTTAGGTSDPSTDFSLLPKVLSFSPTSGATGTQVTITGTAFGANVSDVKFGSVSADPASIVPVSATQVKANVPAGASTGQITVVTDGGQDTSQNNFVVRLSVTALSPVAGPEGAQVEVDGVGFTSTSEVRFGGVLASTRTVHPNGTQIDATVPVGALTGKLTVKTAAGTASSAQTFTVAPTITGFTPSSGAVGTPVTINGRNLQGTTRVDFGGIPQPTLTVNPAGTSISTTVPAGALPGPITVLTPLAMTDSGASSFAVLQTVTGVTPASGHVGQTVELTGTSLSLVDSVDFNGTDAPAFWLGADDSHLEVTVPSGATAGFVTVHDADGHTAHTPGSFALTPGISTFAPASGTAGSTVVITGTDLTGATSVTFNGTPATAYTVDSATQITATVPAGATSGKIVVTAPTGSDTSAEDFLVPAAIASFDPASGSGGDTVTIHGAGFTNVSDVAFNGVAAASYTVVDGATINAVVPAAGSTGKITVTTDGGTATSGTDFTVNTVVDSVSPSTGLAGSVVTIAGRNLGAVTGIDFGGVPAVFGMTSATQITATVPDNAATGALTLHTLSSATGIGGPPFTVAPSLLGFTPVDAAAGATITLTGSGLANVVTVTFGGGAATAPATTSPNSLTVVVPVAAVTGPITVSDGTNASTSDDAFVVD